jgi:hypothetical protein
MDPATFALGGYVLGRALGGARARWLPWALAAAGLLLDLLPLPSSLVVRGDFWPGVLLLLGVGPPILARLVSSEIGERKSPGRGWPIFALLLVAGYWAAKWDLKRRAEQNLESRVYGRESPRRVEALPTAANPLAWTGLVETASTLRVVPVDLVGGFDPEQGRVLFLVPPSPAVEAAKRTARWTEVAGDFRWPHWTVIQAGEFEEVRVEDLRLGRVLEFRVRAGSAEIVEERTAR